MKRPSSRFDKTRPSFSVLAALTLFGLAFALPVAAQEPAGPTIVDVQIEGLRSLSEETLLFYLGLEEGQALDEDRLNDNIKSLWQRQLLDDIAVESEAVEGGVRLIVKVRERPVLRSIDYQGLKRINRSDIQDRIVQENIAVLERSPLARGELERLKAAIEDLYAEKGYRFADARYQLEEVARDEYRVTFTVDEGDRVRIADIKFEGNDVIGDRRLRWAMKKTKESGLINRILKKDIYNPAKLEEDLANIRDLYQRKGYKNITLGDPRVEVRAKRPNAPSPEQENRRMFIEIPVEEGQRFRLGEITIEGNEKYSDQALLRAFSGRSGRWLKSKKLDESIEQVNELYQNTGYIFARVEPELIEREDNVADLIVHVREFDQYRVGRVEFEGNIRTKDKVLRREMRLQEGYVMNAAALRNSVLKVNQLGFFKLDEQEPFQIDVDSEDKTVDLVFEGQESDRFEVQFGGGWSEAFGFEGQFSLRTQNFMGRGETLSFAFQRGQFRNVLDFSYFVPWFLDRPQTVGIRVFDQDLSFRLIDQEFRQDQQGVVLTYGRALATFQQLSLSYTFSDRRDRFRQRFLLPGQDPDVPLPVIELDRTFSSLQPSWTLNRIDNRFEPTRGLRLTGSVEVAGGALGGDSELVRPEAGFTFFKPVSRAPVRSVFGINLEAGYLDLLGDDLLSPFERFYLGGENSIRGHRINTIFVRNPDGTAAFDPDFPGVPLGGDQFFQANLEYHFLTGGPFRVILFVDAGNVWGGSQSVDLSNLRATTGMEMRVIVPFFGAPLRFIYAVNLDPLPGGLQRFEGDDFEDFQFSIGSTF